MTWMMKNSYGEPDGVFTFSAIAFAIVSMCVLMSVFSSIVIGSLTFNIRIPDEGLLLGYLGSTYTAYVLRRNTKDKLDSTLPPEVPPNA